MNHRRSLSVSKWMLLLSCIGLPAVTHASGLAIEDGSGDPASVTVAPGGSFTVGVRLTADQSFVGTSFNIQTAGQAISALTITARAWNPSSPLTVPMSSDSNVVGLPQAVLSPSNGSDLGYLASDVLIPVAAGSYQLENVTLSVASNLPAGQYSLFTVNGNMASGDFQDIALLDSAPYTITVVVPEPGMIGLLALGALPLVRRRAV